MICCSDKQNCIDRNASLTTLGACSRWRECVVVVRCGVRPCCTAWRQRLWWSRSRSAAIACCAALARLASASCVVRVSRIVTTIVLARYLGAAELGIAATALACFELVRVLANNGIGQMVVRAPDDRLAATCNTAYRLSWLRLHRDGAIQIAAGLAIAHVSPAGRNCSA